MHLLVNTTVGTNSTFYTVESNLQAYHSRYQQLVVTSRIKTFSPSFIPALSDLYNFMHLDSSISFLNID